MICRLFYLLLSILLTEVRPIPRFLAISDSYLITKRTEEVGTRAHFGHWEGDTIEFKGTKSEVVTTLVERKTSVVAQT